MIRPLVLAILLTACQQMPGEVALPVCEAHCSVTVIVQDGEQVRGGNSPATTATVPVGAGL